MRTLLTTTICCLITAFSTAAYLRTQEEDMMAKMMELATPGTEHTEFQKAAGEWKMEMEFDWTGSGTFEKTTANTVCKPILGGRYMYEDVSFEMMGMPVTGVSIMGYDKLKGEYISLWMDTMSTWWISSRGKKNADGLIELKGMMPEMQGDIPFRQTIRVDPDGSSTMRMYHTIAGKEVEVMRTRTSR